MIRIKRLVALFFCLAFVTCQTRPIKKATPRVPTGEDAGEGGGNGDSADSTAPLGEANSNPDFQQPAEKKPAESFKDAVASIKVAAQKYLDARKEEQQIPENSEPANPEAERLAQITEVLDHAAEEIVQTPDEDMLERISDPEFVAAVTAGALGEQADNGHVPTFGRNLAIAGGSIFLVSAVAGFVSYQKLKTSVGALDQGKASFREITIYIMKGMRGESLYYHLERDLVGKIRVLGGGAGKINEYLDAKDAMIYDPQLRKKRNLTPQEQRKLESHYRELQILHNYCMAEYMLLPHAPILPKLFEVDALKRDRAWVLFRKIDEKRIVLDGLNQPRFQTPAEYEGVLGRSNDSRVVEYTRQLHRLLQYRNSSLYQFHIPELPPEIGEQKQAYSSAFEQARAGLPTAKGGGIFLARDLYTESFLN